jgi:two-component system, sensor histidine kinase and response regulator
MTQKKYDEAFKYLTESVRICQKQDDKDGISSGYNDLGLCYSYKNQFKQGLYFLNESLRIATDNKLKFNRTLALTGLATSYNLQGNYIKAYPYAAEAKALSDKLGSLPNRSGAILQLSKALAGLNRFQEAYAAQKEFGELRMGLVKDESIQKFTSYYLEADFAEKQRQQELQQKIKDSLYQQTLGSQGLINIIFVIATLAMIVTSGIYYNQKRKQKKVNAMLEDKNHQVLQQKIDIDEQAQKLKDLNVLKDRLISVLAHDLRVPLSTLRGLFSRPSKSQF